MRDGFDRRDARGAHDPARARDGLPAAGAPALRQRVRAVLGGLSYASAAALLSLRSPTRSGTASPAPRGPGDPALRAFLARGLYGPAHVRAPTGSGGFAVAYAPAAGVEWVRIGAAVTFRDGVELRGTQAVTAVPALRGKAREISAAPPGQQAALAAPYRWTPGARDAWLRRLEAVVEGFWSGAFHFVVARPGWESVQARTAVDVDVRPGARAPDDHLGLEVVMVPDDVNAGVGVLASGRDALDNRMVLGASDVLPRPDNMLVERFEFRPERTGASDTDSIRLTMLANRFRAGTPNPPAMTWHVQGDGPDPEASARARFDAIAFHMAAAGFDRGRLRFAFDGPGRAARAVVGDGIAQTAAIHEFGHVLGLKDEYARDRLAGMTGTGRPAGQPAGHDVLARSLGLPGAVHENNEGLMSFGSAMRPTYAATCLWALRRLTGVQEWRTGPPPAASTGAGQGEE